MAHRKPGTQLGNIGLPDFIPQGTQEEARANWLDAAGIEAKIKASLALTPSLLLKQCF